MVSRQLYRLLLEKYKLSQLEAYEIICHFASITKAQVAMDIAFTQEIADKCIEGAVVRNNGQPLQYIIGQWDFCGEKILCKQGVLIPRQDTETVVERAISFSPKRVLDLCCGSGCISVAIAKSCPQAVITAVDIEPKAISLTKDNAALWDVADRIDVSLCDLLKDKPFGSYDMIVSNPPYIKSGDIPTLDKNVREFEPVLALDGGADGLVFYKAILSRWLSQLDVGGHIVFEIGFDIANEVAHLMEQAGLCQVLIEKDSAGNDRCVSGKKLLEQMLQL